MDKHPAAAPTKEPYGGLSFQTVTMTPRGRRIASCAFDVPAQTYGEGWMTGLAAAAELMTELAAAAEHGGGLNLLPFLQEASVAAMEGECGGNLPSRRGAGAAFLRVVEEMVRFAATRCDHRAFIQGQVEMIRRCETVYEQRRARAAAVFVERMRKAKAAKRRAVNEQGGCSAKGGQSC